MNKNTKKLKSAIDAAFFRVPRLITFAWMVVTQAVVAAVMFKAAAPHGFAYIFLALVGCIISALAILIAGNMIFITLIQERMWHWGRKRFATKQALKEYIMSKTEEELELELIREKLTK